MIPESMWPGIFQAEAGRGSPTNARSSRDAIKDTVASYAITNEQRARKRFWKRFWTTGSEPQ
jgi:hypothetical protein